LGSAIDLSVQKDAGTDTVADGDENEIFFRLRCTTIVFALSRKISVVVDHHWTLQSVLEHVAQRHTAPIPQSSKRKHRARFHIDDGGNSDGQPEQLLLCLSITGEKSADFCGYQAAHRWRYRRRPRKPNHCSSEFLPVQISEKKMNGIRSDFRSDYAAPLGLEAEYVGRPSTGRIPPANRIHQSRVGEVSYYIRDRGRA
jgi:hypothetical protein